MNLGKWAAPVTESSATRVERSVFLQFLAVAFAIWLLAHMAGEVGFEPTMMLVTSIRLHGGK